MKMKIEVDDREPLWMDAMILGSGFEVERKRLKCGDYICGGVCIERKTVDDMCGSVCSGRLKMQVDRMLKEFGVGKCFVIVQGRLSDRNSEIHVNSLLGMMVSIVLKGVPVLWVEMEEELMFVMKRLFERCCGDEVVVSDLFINWEDGENEVFNL